MLRMMKEFKNLKKNPDTVKGELWCIDCKEDGHTKGSCPKKKFFDICQVAGHSLEECPFNLKAKGHQQVLLMQEASNNSNNASNDATSGGYRNNNRCRRGVNNNNKNGGRSRIQYDVSGSPMIQCRACNIWGHFARDCTMKEAPQLLCRWCGLGDHEDSKCPKQSVNLLSIETSNENVLAITREQARKGKYPNAEEEKERLQKPRAEVEKQMIVEKSQVKDTTITLKRNLAEQSMVKQIMQTEVPIKLNDLLTMPQLRTAIINMTPSPRVTVEAQDGQEEAKNNKEQIQCY